MSDVGTENIDLSVDRGTRSAVESAVATVAPGGPDVDSAVNTAREHHAREIKKRNDEATPADRSDRLRATIRSAVQEAKNRATAPQQAKGNGFEVPPGPPVSWSKDAKAQWESLPHEARMAALREQKTFAEAVTPLAQRYTELEQAIAPHRELIPQGVSEPQVVNNMFHWYRALRSPNRAAYFAQLMAENGTTLQDVYDVVVQAQQGQQPQYQQPQQEHQQQPVGDSNAAQIQADLAQFAQGRPHFENVRRDMGILLQTHPEQYLTSNGVDLDRAYNDAVRAASIANGSSSSRKRDAAVSPSGRSPSADLATTQHGKGIRGAIKAAIQESRGRM